MIKKREQHMKKFTIPKVNEEGTVTKTIRIKRSLADKLEELSIKNNITVNRLINECVKYALENMEEEAKVEVTE